MAEPRPTCSWEQNHAIQDGTSCVSESRLPGTLQRPAPWVWERGAALYEAYLRALELAPEAIYRHTGYALAAVLKGLLPALMEMLVVLAATTVIGAAAGGVIGFFFGGAGAAPGAVIGGQIGFDVGLAALTWLGLAFLIDAMAHGMGRLWALLSSGVSRAWAAPEHPESRYPHEIERAATDLADAAGVLMLLLLQGLVAWVLKRAAVSSTQSALKTAGAARTTGSEAAADAAMAELVGKLKGSRLGGDFAKWVEDNWPKLKNDPRLRHQPSQSGQPASPPVALPGQGGRAASPPPVDRFRYLADRRKQMGLPEAGSPGDTATLAKLEINGKSYDGINSGLQNPRRPITLERVNAQTRTHAEAEAVQKAVNDGMSGTTRRAEMWTDRDPCAACGTSGGLRSLARNLGVDELVVHSPSGTQVFTPTR